MIASAHASALKERPILFSGPMVRAILEGRKTQTRRVVARPLNHPNWTGYMMTAAKDGAIECGADYPDGDTDFVNCHYGKPGDRIWVRETFYIDTAPNGRLEVGFEETLDSKDDIYYRADGECCDQIPECSCAEVGKPKWRPLIFMPRWASRITLEITDVRVQRLQEIGEDDARAEGIEAELLTAVEVSALGITDGAWPLRQTYRQLWDSINGKKHPWDSNPWVWVIEFRKVAA